MRVQSMVRGRQQRLGLNLQPAETETAPLDQAAHTKGFKWRDMTAQLRDKVLKDHLLLGIWFADPEEQGRAELVQRFFVVIMLAVVIELLLFTPVQDAGVVEKAATFQLSVVAVVVNSVVTAFLTVPALALTSVVYGWGYTRRSPLAERLAGPAAWRGRGTNRRGARQGGQGRVPPERLGAAARAHRAEPCSVRFAKMGKQGSGGGLARCGQGQ
ncbi:hypothetical protein T492DRAFT_209488 [Pavlovales sp. CCMP2436]|nr:hypothetical protein T492DRAFT_209488 [Pavlovales sp. CCMP2436]